MSNFQDDLSKGINHGSSESQSDVALLKWYRKEFNMQQENVKQLEEVKKKLQEEGKLQQEVIKELQGKNEQQKENVKQLEVVIKELEGQIEQLEIDLEVCKNNSQNDKNDQFNLWGFIEDPFREEIKNNESLQDAFNRGVSTDFIDNYKAPLNSLSNLELPQQIENEIRNNVLERWNTKDRSLSTKKFAKNLQDMVEFINDALNAVLDLNSCTSSTDFEKFCNFQLKQDSVEASKSRLTKAFLRKKGHSLNEEEKVIVNYFMSLLSEAMIRVRFHRDPMMGIDIRMVGKIASYDPRYCSSVYGNDANLTSEIKCFVLTPLFCTYVKEDNEERIPDCCKCHVIPILK